MKYRVVIMVEWFIFIIHGLVYDFIVANLSCCWRYYIDDEVIMLIDECLELCWLISWWWYEMWLRWCCFMIRVDFMLRSWDSHSWVFGELFARIQSVEMSYNAYSTICGFMSVMNKWMENLWYYNHLWCWDLWMNLWKHMILIWMIITCMHWWMTLHVSRHVSWGC